MKWLLFEIVSNSIPMKKVSVLLALGASGLLGCGTGLDTTLGTPWAGIKLMGVASLSTTGLGVALDVIGAVHTIGSTTGALAGNALNGISDYAITKRNSAGTLLWTRQVGVAGKYTYGMGIATSPNGTLAICGSTDASLDGTLTGTSDFYVALYDSTGTRQWIRQMGAATKSSTAEKVAMDSSGNVYVAGHSAGGLDGNTVTGTRDLFVAKYTSAGVKSWLRQLGVASSDTRAYGIAIDSNSNVYVTGNTTGSLDGVAINGTTDEFLIKYDSAGTKQWTKLMGSSASTAQGRSVTVGADGAIYVAGSTTAGLDGNTQTGTTDLLVAKFDSSGARTWSRQLGSSTGASIALSVATSSTGAIHVSGYTNVGLASVPVTGTNDAFLVQYDSSGTRQWTKLLGASGANTYAYGVAVNSAGGVFIVGSTGGALGGIGLTGLPDLFIAKYSSAGTLQ